MFGGPITGRSRPSARKEVSLSVPSHRPSPPAVLAAAILTAAALLAGPTPSPAQQSLPAVTHSAPAAAAARGATTSVTLAFTVPPGLALATNPRVRVTDAKGNLVELLPATLTRRPPSGAATRALHTGTYRPGTYQVSAEVVTLNPAGKKV